MKRSHFILVGIALLILACGVTWALLTHDPYFTPVTDWQARGEQSYRVETWHSDAPFETEKVRLVV